MKWNSFIDRETVRKQQQHSYYQATLLEDSIRQKNKLQKTEKMVDYFVKHLENAKNVYGDLVSVLHVFQWKKAEKFEGKSRQTIAFLTKRNNVYTHHLLHLNEKREDCIKEIEIYEPKHFISNFKWNDSTILGIAYPNKSS
ncbi:hypothetical protein [Rummeliibacillus pycnus]|uniref:hypothetical protein n=1 Tax=Rummeliibacillus pycnus TaxID=101070 RepID=UPI003D2A93A2